jgi:flavin reductase (DIM6/NTAB) family NADH-FMN oxidoreductase RutF
MLYPLPAVMVSCSDGTRPNIITVAWAGTICTNPPMLSISVRPERYSYHMIESTGDFVVNLTTKALAFATDYCGVKSGRDVDKFKETNLTPLALSSVTSPAIEESPVNIACKVREIKPLGSHNMIIADVAEVIIEDSYLDANGRFDLNNAELITYSHGEYYMLGEKLGTFGYSVKNH